MIIIAATVTAVAAIVSAVSVTSPHTILRVATTTSLDDAGLWDYLEGIFEKRYAVDLQIIVKGTGMALQLGMNGDVDAVVVHDPSQEIAFVAGGYAVEAEGFDSARVPWAYNYFVIVGPEADPAGICRGNLTPEEAFRRIQQWGEASPGAIKFVSRGDNSGTHGKEKAIWASAGYNYSSDIQWIGATAGWYVEAGSGMGATLVMADQMMAYTLTDKGTFLAYRGNLDSVTLLDTGDILLNVYTAIICRKGSNPEMAQNLVTFLRAPDVQALVAGLGVPDYGERLFYPYDPKICG